MTADDIQWLSEALHAGYAARTPAELATALLGLLHGRFRLAVTCCEDMGQAAADYRLHGLLSHRELPRETPAYLHDHPMIALVHTMPPFCQVRAVASRAAFERTDYFNGIARPMSFNDHAILRLQSQPTSVTVSLCRDRIFNRDECDILRLLQRHLEVCWRRVRGAGRVATAFGVQALALSPGLRPLGLTPVLAARLARYFPGWRDYQRLPPPVRDWVVATRSELDRGAECRLPQVLSVQQGGAVLICRYFPVAGSPLAELRFMERHLHPFGAHPLPMLSPREREILHWIAEGKRDSEIGTILGLSAKTVGKHVEHLLAKLRVPNRTVAAVLGAGQ